MSTSANWINTILPLQKPEYPKQSEMLLTDLLWRSKGSALSSVIANSGETSSYLRELAKSPRVGKNTPSLERLILRATQAGKHDLVETMPIAENASIDGLISSDNAPKPIAALLDSILAPRSRKVKYDSCVPIHPDVVALQTLHGAVNKSDPSNLAYMIEMVGWMGGSDGDGHVAALFLDAFSRPANIREGLTGLVDTLIPRLAQQTWAALPQQTSQPDYVLPSWPQPLLGPRSISQTNKAVLSHHEWTPFSWFWQKWRILCDPKRGWYDKLPARRFADWSMCILRTALAFAYLWEADFFCKLHACLVERAYQPGEVMARDALYSMLKNGTVLVTIEPPRLPATQKHAWNSLNTLLARGYLVRKHFEKAARDYGDTFDPGEDTVDIFLDKWMDSLPRPYLEALAAKLSVPSRETANNAKEFVKYLLQARSADDDSPDQADLYYLARSNSQGFWIHPGPEWLVVITGLLAGEAGGQCTLGMLMSDLARLGIRVERWVLVGLLEEAGLSTDSPDADNALVIHSGF